ncbi:MAG: hypothetical protein ACR2LR_09265 [Hassallia sp.]
MVNESPRQRFGWKKVAVATGIGAVVLIIGTAVYDREQCDFVRC